MMNHQEAKLWSKISEFFVYWYIYISKITIHFYLIRSE